MKKLFVCTGFFILSSSFFIRTSAQTFQFGTLTVQANYGLEVYTVAQHSANTYSNQSKDTTSGAACGSLTVGGEFGVTNWLGLGLNFKLDSYLHNSNVTQANGFESGICANAHFLRCCHLDMFGGINAGYSNLTLSFNDVENYQIYGSGTWFDLHGTIRVYFGRFGFNGTFYVPFINYPELTSNSNTFNEYILDSWKAHGFGFSFGFQYHFLK
jgi:hypothetical protein